MLTCLHVKKRCSGGCGLQYELRFFQPLKSQADGRDPLCRGCRRRDNEERNPRTPR